MFLRWWCIYFQISCLIVLLFRLYVRGNILGYKRWVSQHDTILQDSFSMPHSQILIGNLSCRGKSNQYPSVSLLQIEGVNTVEEVEWYLGKRIAYVYKAKTKKNGTLYRSIWGRVIKPHGNSGVVRAKFRKNLPPSSMVNVLNLLLHSVGF